MLNFSCCGGHLVKTLSCHIGFPNNKKKNINFLKVQIRNIPTKEQFHHTCGFEIQSENIIDYSSHVEFLNEIKYNIEDYPGNISTKFGTQLGLWFLRND